MRFRINDKVFCKIRGNTIVSARSGNYDAQLDFEIIGVDEKSSKYLVLIPIYYSIKGSWNIKEEHIERFAADPNYLDCKALLLMEDRIYRSSKSSSGNDGMFCSNCKEFYPMAEGNQSDGTLCCYQCRLDPWR